MARVSKPMKIITLRIDEEEKARLEHLAQRGDITLSRALREGAALYLTDLQGKLHSARGGRTTFHGIRRDRDGEALTEESEPTPRELAQIAALRDALLGSAFAAIRTEWIAQADTRVVAGALGQWLNLVGELYAGVPGFMGWSWFVRDYCEGYPELQHRERLALELRSATLGLAELDAEDLLDELEIGFGRLLHDVERQELVRRAVLPAWGAMTRAVV